MAKLIPPAGILYFPNAPIIFSAPVRQRAIIDPTNLIDFIKLYTYPSGTYAIINLPGSNVWYDIFTILLIPPGDYQLKWQYYDILYKQQRIVLNGNVIDGPVGGTGSNTLITHTVQIRNAPGYSKLTLQAISTVGYNQAYLANVVLQSSPPADAKVLSQLSVASTSSTTVGTNTTSSPNINAVQPPPIRDTSNIPVKRHGGWIV
jgi:hypothetical protein